MLSMKQVLKIALFLSVICFCAISVSAQDKRVVIRALEVDRKPVDASFKVQIITGDGKVFDAKTDRASFTVPAEVVSKPSNEYVGVIFRFKKHVLTFFTVHVSNFNVSWTVGVDTLPYDPEFLKEQNPDEIQSIVYIVFDGEPERLMVVTTNKPKVTVKRITDD